MRKGGTYLETVNLINIQRQVGMGARDVLSSGAAPDLQSSEHSRGGGEYWGVFLFGLLAEQRSRERERCWEKVPYQVTRRSALQQLSGPIRCSGDPDVITL